VLKCCEERCNPCHPNAKCLQIFLPLSSAFGSFTGMSSALSFFYSICLLNLHWPLLNMLLFQNCCQSLHIDLGLDMDIITCWWYCSWGVWLGYLMTSNRGSRIILLFSEVPLTSFFDRSLLIMHNAVHWCVCWDWTKCVIGLFFFNV